jgi:hypothetical protein
LVVGFAGCDLLIGVLPFAFRATAADAAAAAAARPRVPALDRSAVWRLLFFADFVIGGLLAERRYAAPTTGSPVNHDDRAKFWQVALRLALTPMLRSSPKSNAMSRKIALRH